MAYIKIFGIKSTVKKAVDYITNSDKTDDHNPVSSYGCSPETADLEFAMTAKMGKDNVMEKGNNLAWHMIISFKTGETTDPNVAHEVATKIADATLKGKHELRIVFPLKLHYFFTIFHYFIVFASELSNARISGLANTFARSSGLTSSATVALLFSCCTCICGSRFFFS